jgi:hypothetical protein
MVQVDRQSSTSQLILTALSQNSPDVNADGAVNIQDMVLVANNIGQQGQNRADVNRDGVVNVLDLVSIANAFVD